MKLTRKFPTLLVFVFSWVWGFLLGAYVIYVIVDPAVGNEFVKFKISDIINSTVALIIAFLVTHTLGRQSSKEQKVKDLLVESVSALCTLANQTYSLCIQADSSGKLDKKAIEQVNLLFRQHSKSLSTFSNRVELYGIAVDFSQIVHNFLRFKSYTTNDYIVISPATKHYLELTKLYDNLKFDIMAC